MEISYPSLTLLVLAILSFYYAYNIYKRVRLLKSANVPYFIVLSPEIPIKFRILRELPPYKAFVKYLLKPLGLGDFADYQVLRWRVNRRKWAKDFGHGKFGGIYCQVSPQWIQIEVGDREFVNYLSGKDGRVKFEKPKHQYKVIDLYGENVVSSTEAHWPRHRRLVAPIFNERSYATVWQASINQALQMQYHWTSRESGNNKRSFTESGDVVISEPGQDAKKLTLHVLSFAAFGIDIPYSKSYLQCNSTLRQESDQARLIEAEKNSTLDSSTVLPGFSMSFQRAFEYTTDHFQSLLLFVYLWPFWENKSEDGIQTLPKPKFASVLPESLKTNIAAWLDMGRYLGTIINLEKMSLLESNQRQEKKREKDSLLSFMVRNSILADQDSHHKAGNAGFSPEELVGNAYIFALAGHETTAAAIEYALVLLSLFQEAQNWFLAALDEELAGMPEDPREWKHDELLQKLVSCKCLMFEVLRFFPPVPNIPKWVNPVTFPNGTTITLPRHSSLNTKSTEWVPFHIPPNTFVYINTYALHYNPDYWGPDVNEFRPSRWDSSRDHQRKEWLAQSVDPETRTELQDSTHTEPGVYTPPKGQYIPFSFGHRACLGRKFAIVEFVAAIAVLLRNWRVDLVDLSGKGKTREELERYVWEKIEKTSYGITVRIAKHVPLKLIRRRNYGGKF